MKKKMEIKVYDVDRVEVEFFHEDLTSGPIIMTKKEFERYFNEDQSIRDTAEIN